MGVDSLFIPHEVSPALYDGVKLTPKQRVEDVAGWIAEEYPKKWMRLVGLCEWAKAQGWPRIRRGDLFVLASMKGLPITTCNEFRFDNNLWSILSRYLLMFRAELATVIFPKKAAIDDPSIDFERIWHENVARNTFFEARTWQDAQRMHEVAA